MGNNFVCRMNCDFSDNILSSHFSKIKQLHHRPINCGIQHNAIIQASPRSEILEIHKLDCIQDVRSTLLNKKPHSSSHFATYKFLCTMLLFINSCAAASNFSGTLEYDGEQECFFGEFLLFDTAYLKNNVTALNLREGEFGSGKHDEESIDEKICDIFIFQYAVIDDWNRLLKSDEHKQMIISYCDMAMIEIKNIIMNDQSKDSLLINCLIDCCIDCLIKLKDVLRNDGTPIEDGQSSLMQPNPQLNVFEGMIVQEKNIATELVGVPQVADAFEYENNVDDPHQKNIQDVYTKIKNSIAKLNILKSHNILDAFSVLKELINLIASSARMVYVIFSLNSVPPFTFADIQRLRNEFIKLHLGSKMNKIFSNMLYINYLIMNYASATNFEANYVKQLESLKERHEIHGTTEEVNERLNQVIKANVFTRICIKHQRVYSIQCFLLFAINFFNESIFNKQIIKEILDLISNDEKCTNENLLKCFCAFLYQVDKTEVELQAVKRVAPKGFEDDFKDVFNTYNEFHNIYMVPEEYYRHFKRIAGAISIKPVVITQDGTVNLTTDKLLSCLNFLINHHIMPIGYENSGCCLKRNRILQHIIDFSGQVFLNANSKKEIDEVAILSHYQYIEDDGYFQCFYLSSIDVIVGDIIKLNDINEARLMIFYFDFISLFDTLSISGYTSINIIRVRKVFIDKLSKKYNKEELCWPGVDKKSNIVALDELKMK